MQRQRGAGGTFAANGPAFKRQRQTRPSSRFDAEEVTKRLRVPLSIWCTKASNYSSLRHNILGSFCLQASMSKPRAEAPVPPRTTYSTFVLPATF